jgi:transcriptional regulator with XRE-family HTH domain
MRPSYWIDQIHELAEVHQVSLRQLAKKLDISHAYLGKVTRGEKATSASLKIKLWALQRSALDRATMLELLLPDDVAAEFRELEKYLATRTSKPGSSA